MIQNNQNLYINKFFDIYQSNIKNNNIEFITFLWLHEFVFDLPKLRSIYKNISKEIQNIMEFTDINIQQYLINKLYLDILHNNHHKYISHNDSKKISELFVKENTQSFIKNLLPLTKSNPSSFTLNQLNTTPIVKNVHLEIIEPSFNKIDNDKDNDNEPPSKKRIINNDYIYPVQKKCSRQSRLEQRNQKKEK